MAEARFIVGDVRAVAAALPDASVDLVLTSPPFLALRSYLPADHADKALEVGGEPTPGAFIDTLLDVVEALAPKMAPHGSMCFELGDTYSGSGGAGGDYNAGGLRDGQSKFDGSNHRRRRIVDHDSGRRNPAVGWPTDKSLCLIPELFRVSLAYGQNPLTGRSTPRWRVRNVIRWCRPNPPVGALGDKFRPATSDMVVICQSRTRYFDLDAVRMPSSGYERAPGAARATPNGQRPRAVLDTVNPGGAPPLDWWEVSTEPYPGSHYATWPRALLTRPVLAMCPERVCTACGKPSERIVERSPEYAAARDAIGDFNQRDGRGEGVSGSRSVLSAAAGKNMTCAEHVTVGWTDCGHDSWRSGVVLDPFAGSGTTLAVATGHGRDAIGIDLDERNAWLARERVGMLLSVENQEAVA